MSQTIVRSRFALIATLMILALVFAACGRGSSSAPAEEEAAQTSAETEEESSEEETTEEAEEDAEEDNEAVQESGASQGSVEAGVTVTSDEDVTTPRSNFGGEYRSSSTSDFVSFHPYSTTDTASSAAQANVYTGGLLRLDEQTLEYIPHMAESYTISEDGLTFTFKLREDMLWSDGEPITANDFKWTYDMAVEPDNGYPYRSQLEFMTSYEALDDYTLEID